MAQDKAYINQRRRTQRRLTGKQFAGRDIIKVGSPIDERMNCPTLIPVQFKDGTYGIIWSEKERQFLTSSNPKLSRALRLSKKMPFVQSGIGSNVVHLWVYPKKKNIKYAFGKVYYNFKSDRADEYGEVTHAAAARAAAKRKAAEAQTGSAEA